MLSDFAANGDATLTARIHAKARNRLICLLDVLVRRRVQNELRSWPSPWACRASVPRWDEQASDQFDLAQPFLEIFVGRDRQPLGLLACRNGALQRLDQEVRAEVQEEGHRIAG